MATALFHGAYTALTIGHEGQCFVDEYDVAERYARGGDTCGILLDMSALVVESCEGYDRAEDYAQADSAEFRAAAAARGVDILVYDDEDINGNSHTCYRLVSERAVAMARATGVELLDADEAEDFWRAA
jgi:hypothetical protein